MMKRLKKISLISMLLILAIAISGCGGGTSSKAPSDNGQHKQKRF